jgi:hypothetical protein
MSILTIVDVEKSFGLERCKKIRNNMGLVEMGLDRLETEIKIAVGLCYDEGEGDKWKEGQSAHTRRSVW